MRSGDPRLPAVLLVADLNLVFLWPLLEPWVERPLLGAALAALVTLHLVTLVRPQSWLTRLDRAFRRSEPVRRAALLVSSLAVAGGGLEYLADGLTSLGVVDSYSAMRTMLPEGSEDWRLAHLTADRHREPDPELLWRPRPRPPYNRQRFKGPELSEPRSDGTRRLFSYGDSNTDGPDRGGWPERLGARRAPRGWRVVNAGVAGYSSYQGLLRFRREVARYRPDLVLVSFGWNDLAPALGAPDRSYRPPPAPLVAAQRALLRYRFFLVARRYWPRGAAPAAVGPRVALADYRANLEGFIDTATEHGARVALLTRPHREPEAALRALPDNWRRRVPDYNEALRRVAAARGVLVIDVQREFADRPELFVDECHFTPDGHARMAAQVAGRLAAAGLLHGSNPADG